MDERTSFIEHDLIESRQQTGRLPTTVLFLLLLIMIGPCAWYYRKKRERPNWITRYI